MGTMAAAVIRPGGSPGRAGSFACLQINYMSFLISAIFA
jgi:hypothetical protein